MREGEASVPRDESSKQEQLEFEANAGLKKVNELNHAKCASNL